MSISEKYIHDRSRAAVLGHISAFCPEFSPKTGEFFKMSGAPPVCTIHFFFKKSTYGKKGGRKGVGVGKHVGKGSTDHASDHAFDLYSCVLEYIAVVARPGMKLSRPL